MKTINVTLSDEDVERKEALEKKKTWPEIVEKGIKSFEQAEKRKK